MPVQVPANRPVFDFEIGDEALVVAAIGIFAGAVAGTLVGVGVVCGTSEIGAGNRCALINNMIAITKRRIVDRR
jgi:hypothetical protein